MRFEIGESIRAGSEQSSEATRQAAAAAEQLSVKAEQLQGLVQQFRVNADIESVDMRAAA